jgi:hypothetical protein
VITVRVKVICYDKASHTCEAKLLNGDIINLDPFVGCAIDMTDEDYEEGIGFHIVGNSYLLTEYTVYKDSVVPSKGGMIAV